MQPSPELLDIVLKNYKKEGSEGGPQDVARLFYSTQEGVIVLGSEPEDWHEDQESIARLFGSAGSQLNITVDTLRAYCEGSVGWTADQVRLKLPNGVEIPIRHTRVFHKENGEWKVVHLHVSVAVPDAKIDLLYN